LKKINSIITIVGQRGSGKTTLAKMLVLMRSRVVVLDPLCEYGNEGLIFESLGDLVNFMSEHSEGQFRVICRFESMEEYDTLLDLSREIGMLTVVIEELNFFIQVQSKNPHFDQLYRFGRHRGVSVIGIAQRCAEIPKLITSQSDSIISFRQTEPGDLKYLSSVSFIGSEGAAKLPDLEKYKGLDLAVDKHFLIFGHRQVTGL